MLWKSVSWNLFCSVSFTMSTKYGASSDCAAPLGTVIGASHGERVIAVGDEAVLAHQPQDDVAALLARGRDGGTGRSTRAAGSARRAAPLRADVIWLRSLPR